MKTASLKLRLTLNVTYTPNGVTSDELRAILESVATHATNNGLLTGETPAEVDEYDFNVETDPTIPRAIVEVSGGVANDIHSTVPISWDVLDHDNMKELPEGDEERKYYEDLKEEIGKMPYSY